MVLRHSPDPQTTGIAGVHTNKPGSHKSTNVQKHAGVGMHHDALCLFCRHKVPGRSLLPQKHANGSQRM
jgi:hypothetical protein